VGDDVGLSLKGSKEVVIELIVLWYLWSDLMNCFHQHKWFLGKMCLTIVRLFYKILIMIGGLNL